MFGEIQSITGPMIYYRRKRYSSELEFAFYTICMIMLLFLNDHKKEGLMTN